MKNIIIAYDTAEEYSKAYTDLKAAGFNVAVVVGMELALTVKGEEVGNLIIEPFKAPEPVRPARAENQAERVKTAEELGQPAPRFGPGDRVKMKSKTLQGETEGVVESAERVYRQVGPDARGPGSSRRKRFTRRPDGQFDPDGLWTMESTVGGVLPFRFDGETIEVEYPASKHGEWTRAAHVLKSRFAGYSYTVRTPKMLTSYPERALSKI